VRAAFMGPTRGRNGLEGLELADVLMHLEGIDAATVTETAERATAKGLPHASRRSIATSWRKVAFWVRERVPN
jgi:hypothetical protein